MRLLIFVIGMGTICSCEQRINTGEIYNHSLNISDTSNTIQYYLPIEKFTDTSTFIGSDTFSVDRYSNKLRALREPILYNKGKSMEIYRFIWLRTFHNPVAIRIEKEKEEYSLYWKVADGKGGYDPGNLRVYKSRQLSKSDWDKFQHHIKRINFWNAKTVDEKLSGFDGSRWILEGVGQNGYHVTDRWTPRENDYFKCGEFLIKLTDLVIEEDEMY